MSTYLEHRLKLKLEGKPPKEKKVYKIPRESKKRAKLNREYAKESRPVWRGKQCDIRSPECTKVAQGIHHPAGKATMELLMDKDNWIPSCNLCNAYVERFPEWAKEGGFKKSRLILTAERGK